MAAAARINKSGHGTCEASFVFNFFIKDQYKGVFFGVSNRVLGDERVDAGAWMSKKNTPHIPMTPPRPSIHRKAQISGRQRAENRV